VFVPRTSSTSVAMWFWQTKGRGAEHVILGVRQSGFILLEFRSPSRRIFIGSHSLPPLSGGLIGPSCDSHLIPLATGSLERNLFVFSTPGGLTGNDLSRLFFTCTNTSQAATCTCNTWPRISPHNIVNYSSHQEVTIHQASNHSWSSISP
jgi:hypothetical protein